MRTRERWQGRLHLAVFGTVACLVLSACGGGTDDGASASLSTPLATSLSAGGPQAHKRRALADERRDLNGTSSSTTGLDNVAAFDYEPKSQWNVPFPSDTFTVEDYQMISERRVKLSLPPDETLVSERKDIDTVNVLDGFSIFPRITVPLFGATPDVDTFNSEHVFLVTLAPIAKRGRVIRIDQRIIDNAVDGSPRLIFAPDEYLNEQSRYAIVVTKGLTGGGRAYGPNTAFLQLIDRYQRGIVPSGPYLSRLYDALDALVAGGLAKPADLATLSVFTTRTVSDVQLKLIQRLIQDKFPVSPPRFDIDDKPGPEVFRVADILTIDSYVHRASKLFDSNEETSFPPDTLRIQDSGPSLSGDVSDEVYIENLRTGLRVLVPQQAVDQKNGAISSIDLSSLTPQLNDELAVLVRKKRLKLFDRPYFWEKLGFVAFGSVQAPRYTDDNGAIPPTPTGAAFVPPQIATESIVFALFLPPTPSATFGSRSSSLEAEGWPVAHLLHGGAESTSSFLSSEVFNTAPILASRGIATAAFTAAGFEGGPQSRVEIRTRFGVRKIPGVGRGLDVDRNGSYEKTDLYVYPQRVSDLGSLVRSIQTGVDFNGDGVPDLARSPERTYVAGISFGGGAAFISAALEPNASVFVANVPRSEGSRVHTSGFHPIVAELGRSLSAEKLGSRTPGLLNGPSPIWRGAFNEDIPLKRQAVQMGIVPGAEAIQRALDFNMWRDLENMPLAFAAHVGSGALRGNPAQLLIQVARGDGASVNPIQALMIRAGQLESKTALIQLDNEPRYDQQWAQFMPPELARHGLIALPYIPTSGRLEVAGRICHFTRVQIAEYLRLQGSSVPDMDGIGGDFNSNVFEFPVTSTLLEEMMINPGLPSLSSVPAQRGKPRAMGW